MVKVYKSTSLPRDFRRVLRPVENCNNILNILKSLPAAEEVGLSVTHGGSLHGQNRSIQRSNTLITAKLRAHPVPIRGRHV